MKKRLPLIAVFVCAIAVFLILLFMPKAEKAADRDNDGFPDNIDQCIDKPSKINNGCPEEALPQAEKKEDRDGDGFFLTNLQGEADANDSDPCVPNKNCPICDLDNDGLTLQEERLKQTNPNMADTDSDSISDNIDDCPTDYGHKNNNGCKIDLPINFTADAYSVSWNPEINEYASSVNLIFKGYRIPVYMQDSYPAYEIRKRIGSYNSTIYLEIELNDPDAINLFGNIEIDFK